MKDIVFPCKHLLLQQLLNEYVLFLFSLSPPVACDKL
nr:MAG TPA: hypothetical protein [Caudoviricetes sp.]